MQDAQNAWRYDIQCMKGPTKIERNIYDHTKKIAPQKFILEAIFDFRPLSLRTKRLRECEIGVQIRIWVI